MVRLPTASTRPSPLFPYTTLFPSISVVVGLHFLPMARFMNVPSYWFCGVVLMLGAAATAFAIGSRAAAPTQLVALESLFNAMVLWATAAWGLRSIESADAAHADADAGDRKSTRLNSSH